MKIEVWWIGKTFQEFTRQGFSDYQKRIQRFIPFDVKELGDVKGQPNPASLRSMEAEKVWSKLKNDDYLILLDEKGKEYTSTDFAAFLEKKEAQSIKRLVFLIGGAYGFDESVYLRANDRLSLSKMTYSHQLIRLIFAEQLYRAYTIIHKFPYHNEG
jgi:23S rRNA (pseudouridine1915-N3)-methyltransferase